MGRVSFRTLASALYDAGSDSPPPLPIMERNGQAQPAPTDAADSAEAGPSGSLAHRLHVWRVRSDHWQVSNFRILGGIIADRPVPFVLLTLLTLACLGFGLFEAVIETELNELWVNKHTRLEDEKQIFDRWLGGIDRVIQVTFTDKRGGAEPNVLGAGPLRDVAYVDASILDSTPHVHSDEWPSVALDSESCFLLNETQCAKKAMTCEWNGNGRGVCMEADPFGLKPSFMYRDGVTVEYLGVRWGYREICLEVEMPASLPVRAACSAQLTPLDCFAEAPRTLNPGIIEMKGWSRNHPVSRESGPAELGRAAAGVCRLWSGAPVPKGYTMGGVTLNENKTAATRVSAWNNLYPTVHKQAMVRKFRYIMQHPMSASIYRSMGFPEELTEGQAEAILELWEEATSVQMMENKLRVKHTELSWMSVWGVEELTEEAATRDKELILVGFALMQVVVWLFVFNPDAVRSRTHFVGTGGVICIMCAVVGSMGFSALCGIHFNGLSLQVLPYVSMGLGIDDMFVLLHYFDPTPSLHRTVRQRVQDALASAGPSITATSLVNMAAFFAGSGVPVGAVQAFALQSAISVIFNYVSILFAFTAILTIDARRIEARRQDVLWCLQRGPGSADDDEQEEEEGDSWTASLERFRDTVVGWYSHGVTHPVGMAVALLLSLGLLGAAAYGCGDIDRGLDASDFTMDGSVEQAFFHYSEVYFDAAVNYVCAQPGATWSARDKQQVAIELVGFTLNNPANIFGIPGGQVTNQDEGFPPGAASWLLNFRVFAMQVGAMAPDNDPALCADASSAPMGGLLAPKECVIDPAKFHELLGFWLGDTSCSSAWCQHLERQVLPNGQLALGSGSPFRDSVMLSVEDNTVSGIAFSRFTVINMIPGYGKDAMSAVRAIEETRDLLDALNAKEGTNFFAYGPTYAYNEQYVYSEENLGTVLGLALLCTLVVLSGLMVSLQLGVLMTAVITSSQVVILAMMRVLGLQLNGISLLSVVFGVALNVEQSVHIARTFLICNGTRAQRTREALRQMAAPVFAGALTTFVAVLPLAWSDIQFFYDYFFVMYPCMLVVALWHAFVPLPVLLCLFGPSAVRTPPPQSPAESGKATELAPRESSQPLQSLSIGGLDNASAGVTTKRSDDVIVSFPEGGGPGAL
eukprot:TRINITY_DN3106_c0_g1_i1.p1 TRINITY_DN3106_c0_g1~~TRINITY_DN3106_c0_g1_i1.p1  ORF type:complete len:1147 (+),score=328.69 TRINITY_DN3106_c0_g1_i1:55-3495(+)